VVSGAAGAVGSMVGQIGKLKACHVVGIAGGAEKCRYLIEELGFDAAIDYKAEPDLAAALHRECPNGIDVYFDNVGGPTLDAVLAQINFRARVVLCGAISQYNSDRVQGPQNYLALLSNRARMEGFIVLDHAARYAEAQQQLAIWLADGQLKSREHVVEGLDTFPETLMKLFSGENFGKLVLKV
jgi:NADPH-dependent curcumin reductase CurA